MTSKDDNKQTDVVRGPALNETFFVAIYPVDGVTKFVVITSDRIILSLFFCVIISEH
jgi:hypothetical protein